MENETKVDDFEFDEHDDELLEEFGVLTAFEYTTAPSA